MDESQISSIVWERIENFVGFGRRDAPVVFIGMEEGLKEAGDLLADLAIRSTYEHPVMDLKEAHRDVAGTERYFDPDSAPRQPTWRVMADLMLRREGSKSPTGDERRRYRALRLGRSGGDTLLAELLPYPHPKNSDWLYKPFGKFETRADYENSLLPERKRLLSGVLGETRRELRLADANGARVLLTTHFADRGFNTDVQLEELARVALQR